MCFGGGGGTTYYPQEQQRQDTTYAYLDKVPVKRESKDPSAPVKTTTANITSKHSVRKKHVRHRNLREPV